MAESREHQNFHVGLKGFIADKDKLLILQDGEGLWELPGGRVEQQEAHKELEEILRREITEELGESFEYNLEGIFHAWVRKPDPKKGLSDQTYRNKDFHIFLVGFKCTYKQGDIKLSPEHTNFRWITKDEAEDLEFENTYKEAVQQYFKSAHNVL